MVPSFIFMLPYGGRTAAFRQVVTTSIVRLGAPTSFWSNYPK